jgi:catechol 2,3-dioxygenase-like lactoylglutathione lyase family enzyme
MQQQMKVKRIVPNINTPNVAKAKAFYEDVLGLTQEMDLGWIATYGSTEQTGVQISVASQGGSDTATPDFTIEVDDLDAALSRMAGSNIAVEYGPADEPWGVRRFYVRDPFGKLINVMSHRAEGEAKRR